MIWKKRLQRLGLPALCLLAMAGAWYITASKGQASPLSILALPFVWAGEGIRALSLLGGLGNIAAWAVYLCLCALPLAFPLARLIRKKNLGAEDWLLPLLSGYSAFLIYHMVNPQLVPLLFFMGQAAQGMDMVHSCILASVFWAILAAHVVLKALKAQETEKLLRSADLLLCAIGLALALSVFYSDFQRLLFDLGAAGKAAALPDVSITSGNVPERVIQELLAKEMGINTFSGLIPLAVVRFCMNAIPSLLLLWIIPAGRALLWQLSAAPHAPESGPLCALVAVRAKRAAMAAALCAMALNVFQLLVARTVPNVNVTLFLPLFELLLAFGTLLLSKGLQESWRLYDENRQFV